MKSVSIEQRARDILSRIGVCVPNPQQLTSGDLAELANLIQRSDWKNAETGVAVETLDIDIGELKIRSGGDRVGQCDIICDGRPLDRVTELVLRLKYDSVPTVTITRLLN